MSFSHTKARRHKNFPEALIPSAILPFRRGSRQSMQNCPRHKWPSQDFSICRSSTLCSVHSCDRGALPFGRNPRPLRMETAVMGLMRMPACVVSIVAFVPGSISYNRRNLRGMTICPFVVKETVSADAFEAIYKSYWCWKVSQIRFRLTNRLRTAN